MFLKDINNLDDFQRDSQGRKLFFPWAPWGRGVIIDDKEQEKNILNFLRRYNEISNFYFFLLPTIIFPLVLLCYYEYQVNKIIKNLPCSTEKFKFSHNNDKVLNSKKLSTFIIRAIIFLSLLVLTFFITKSAEGISSKITFIFAMVFLLYGLIFNGYMIFLKIKQK